MAYSFNGSNQRLSTASTPVSSAPFTLFVRNLHNGGGTNRALLGLYVLSTSERWQLTGSGGSFPRQLNYIVTDSGGTINIQNLASLAQDTWYSAGFVEAASNSRYAFFETSKSSTNTATFTPSGVNGIGIGGPTAGGAFTTHPGYLAEAAIWDVALNDDEAISLARGFKPSRIRPQHLQFYAPIIRNLQDFRGALTITNVNSATVIEHPRVY
jgi:hypothetical protein